jgi:phospholipid/cholesterol/gamma-HCH transport system ATP-binding protein
MNSVIEIGDNIMFVYQGQNWWTGDKTAVLSNTNKELTDFVFASEFMKTIFKGQRGAN